MDRSDWRPSSFARLLVTGWLAAGAVLWGQTTPDPARPDPVKWSLRLEPATAAPGAKVLGRLTAKVEPGWHLYSLTTPRPPIATTVTLAESPAIAGSTVYAPAPKRANDPNFGVETETYEADTEFLLELEVASAATGTVELTAQSRYQACNDKVCLLPVRRTATASLKVDAAARAAAIAIPAGYTKFTAPPAATAAATAGAAKTSAGNRAIAAASGSEGVGQFLLLALTFGFLAIFTPCVFPMIPITMSFFLSTQTGSRAQSVIQALTFCLGVIVLFTGLGAGVTAIVGPFGLSQLGSSPWVNLFIAVVFGAFGLSLLGAFEITVPSGVLTGLTNASNRGGILGTLIMGLAFALASFACTGPFVGTLLAGAAQGGTYWPILGMLVFATGLASPFFFLALFPAYLQRLPKSGGWLKRTKVTLGFLILAAMFKYLSNIDQVYQWNLLTRERFLAIWIVLLVLAGLYLLGLLKLEGDKDEPVSLWRLGVAAAILMFAASLLPGMFGGRLGEFDAYVPTASESSLASGGAAGGLQWLKNDYAGALAAAKQSGKPIFVSFTGYACTNCHWMKANMFTRPEIAAALQKFVLVELYVDGADAASEANQKMLEGRFNIIAIPYYAVIRPDDTVVDTFPSLTRKPAEFEAFLNRTAGTATAAVGGPAVPGQSS